MFSEIEIFLGFSFLNLLLRFSFAWKFEFPNLKPFFKLFRFDDLAVGAPLFTNKFGNRIGQDEGRVFIFINNGKGVVSKFVVHVFM